MRFDRKGKLSPRYIGSYEIVERVGSVAYWLLLPLELERIHDVFHVLMLRRYRLDLSHVMPVEEIDLNPNLSYDEEPVEILASDSKVLRGRTIELVKVKWRHRGVEEATWERNDDMMEQFPYLFPSGETDSGGPNEVLEASGRSLAWGKQEGKEDQGVTFVQVRFCGYGSMYKQWGGSNSCISGLEYRNQHSGIGTDSSLESVYRYCYIGTGTTLVSVPAFEYRYWLPENGFWSPLKPDPLRVGP
ncbi:hypothetical protein V6N11_018576 [Hibiscus sabdariffa]|uniref:Tf2-1-like SH3-like domain-containing protein n=1 Tax=Hibiscus sabdariffa TaxID=183260 RepID=A0ABR2NA71_9ROSI